MSTLLFSSCFLHLNIICQLHCLWEFFKDTGGSEVKNPPANAGDVDSIPGSGRSPGEGNGNPLQYSFLENPMDGGTWRAAVHGGRKELDMTE